MVTRIRLVKSKGWGEWVVSIFISVFLSFSPYLQSGKLSKELDFVSHHVRTKLDELKRQEVSRLRMLIKAKMDATMEESA